MAQEIWLQALILGLIQGICEFLPISSSAHLLLLPHLTGWPYLGKAFDIALHFGSLLALLLFFRTDLGNLIGAAPQAWQGLRNGHWRQLQGPPRLLLQLALASLPVGLVGLLLDDWMDQHLHHLSGVALSLALFGLALGLAEARGSGRLEIQQLRWSHCLWLGLAQTLALLPGVSRCGITLTAGLWLGLERREALRLSFLMAVPVLGAAALLKLLKGSTPMLSAPGLLGMAAAAISGALCLRWMLTYVRHGGLAPFVVYRLLLAGVLLLLSLGE